MADIQARFWVLCDKAIYLEKANRDASQRDEQVASDCRSYERPMVELIELVEANPEHRETFVRCFCDLVQWRRHVPFDLVAFCMRRLRFPEIPELIRRDAETHGRMSSYYIDHMAHWSSINHAYLDFVWEDAGRWAYYSERELVPEMVSTLTQRLSLPDHREQLNAAWALRAIGPPARSALPALNTLLRIAMQEGWTNLMNALERAIDSIRRDVENPTAPEREGLNLP